MLLALRRIDDVDSPVPTRKPFLDEWEQYTVLLSVIGKECTNVTQFPQLRTG